MTAAELLKHFWMHVCLHGEEGGANLFMDFLQEDNLVLQVLVAFLQVLTSHSGSIHVLQQQKLFYCHF